MRDLLAATVVVGVMVLAGCAASSVDTPLPRQLTVGECVDFGAYVTSEGDDVAGDGTSSLPAVDCEQPHDGEVFAVADSALDSFDEEALIAEADTLCYGAFEDYVGAAYADSELYYSIVYPTGSTWKQGDRMLACVLVGTEQTAGSLAGSGL